MLTIAKRHGNIGLQTNYAIINGQTGKSQSSGSSPLTN